MTVTLAVPVILAAHRAGIAARVPAPQTDLPVYEQGVTNKRSTSPLAEVPKLVT